MNAGTLKDAVVIPLGTIIQSVRGSIVYVVEQGKAVLRPVKVIESRGEDAAVTGVKAGELVVLDGRENLRPGSPVFERAREGAGSPAQAASMGAGARPVAAPGIATAAPSPKP